MSNPTWHLPGPRAAPPRRGGLRRVLFVLALFLLAGPARSEELPEYRLKAAFLYNFAVFTEWPADVGSTINLCIHGADPFGSELDSLQGKKVGERSLAVHRKAQREALNACQIVFIASTAADQLPRVLDTVRGLPVLTVADTPGAMQLGVALNMQVTQGRITFEANLKSARAARLNLSSRLLRLATEVLQ